MGTLEITAAREWKMKPPPNPRAVTHIVEQESHDDPFIGQFPFSDNAQKTHPPSRLKLSPGPRDFAPPFHH
jgi:hypothetical protein